MEFKNLYEGKKPKRKKGEIVNIISAIKLKLNFGSLFCISFILNKQKNKRNNNAGVKKAEAVAKTDNTENSTSDK